MTMRAFSESGNDLIAAFSAPKQESLIDGSSGIRNTQFADRLGVTMNYLSKWFFTAILGALVLLRHDAEVVWFAMGSVLNHLLSLTLKRTLKQERPSALSSGHGMPSSHAQFIFYSAVVFIVSSVEWLGLNATTTIISGIVLAFGSYFSWLRVSLHYHTLGQVGVGAMMGSIFSIFWFWVWNTFVSKAFISSFWIGIIVFLGAYGSAVSFLLVVLHCWLNDED